MTRKHFTAIAAELLRQRPERDGSDWANGARDEWSTIVIGIAGTLAAFNPNFDRGRFLAAAGLDR